MRKLVVIALLALLAAVATGDVTMFNATQQSALTTIDIVPTWSQLQGHELVVPDDLITIAANTEMKFEPAVRLRAIHGLAVYCTTQGVSCPDASPAHDTLASLIGANEAAHAGADLLVLRAAIESLGPLEVPGDKPLLVAMLNHPSRDIRAATARALADLRNCQAINDLRVRYQNESTDQVKLVISETLRILSQPNYCLVN
ncbi:MAG: HEAT repeat domain-containing protein [Deltaproteobacteria bacterium]|nr:HEAT repeat domain-containing protein [Deltaproteobacteria bacterium]